MSGKGGKSDGKGHGNLHSLGGPYLCIKCGDMPHFMKDCQCLYNRAYSSYVKKMIDKSRIALESESTELCVQERLFGKKSVSKNSHSMKDLSIQKSRFSPQVGTRQQPRRTSLQLLRPDLQAVVVLSLLSAKTPCSFLLPSSLSSRQNPMPMRSPTT